MLAILVVSNLFQKISVALSTAIINGWLMLVSLSAAAVAIHAFRTFVVVQAHCVCIVVKSTLFFSDLS